MKIGKDIAAFLFVVAMSSLGYSGCFAQSPSKVVEDFKPSSVNQPGERISSGKF